MSYEVVEPPYPYEREPGVPATPEEVIDSWTGLRGKVTINAHDFCALRKIGCGRFEPITEAYLIRTFAHYGTFDTFLQIHVSRGIPVGYFYYGPNVPDLLPIQIPEGAERVIRRKMPPEIQRQIREGLHPFRSRISKRKL